jgi:hypothetical protein
MDRIASALLLREAVEELAERLFARKLAANSVLKPPP